MKMRSHNAPVTNSEAFENALERAVANFARNSLLLALESGDLKLEQFQALLRVLYHQVKSSCMTFLLAANNCRDREGGELLRKKAEEERGHEIWILEDLAAQGFAGTMPDQLKATDGANAYIEHNKQLAANRPFARLATSAFLEAVSATIGGSAGPKLFALLGLEPEQLVFCSQHAELDVGHVEEVLKVMESMGMTQDEWAAATYAMQRAGELYAQMFEEAMLLGG